MAHGANIASGPGKVKMEKQTVSNEESLSRLKDVFKPGGKYTMFYIGSAMAMTHKREILVKTVDDDGAVYVERGKRTMYRLKFQSRSYATAPLEPLGCAVFAGWDQPITCDTCHKGTTSQPVVMRGNACYNFVAMPLEVAAWIESGQLNPFFERTRVLAIEGDAETVVFPEEVTRGNHAVIDRIIARAEGRI